MDETDLSESTFVVFLCSLVAAVVCLINFWLLTTFTGVTAIHPALVAGLPLGLILIPQTVVITLWFLRSGAQWRLEKEWFQLNQAALLPLSGNISAELESSIQTLSGTFSQAPMTPKSTELLDDASGLLTQWYALATPTETGLKASTSTLTNSAVQRLGQEYTSLLAAHRDYEVRAKTLNLTVAEYKQDYAREQANAQLAAAAERELGIH